MNPFVVAPLLVFWLSGMDWYGYSPKAEAQVEKPAFTYYYVGTIWSPQIPVPGVDRSTTYSSHQHVYWFTSGDDECYVSTSSSGGGISCMKKGSK